MASTPFAFDRITWQRWRRAVRAFATSSVGTRARWMFAGLMALLVAINALNVVNSYVGRDFMTAIEQRSMKGFVTMGFLYVAVFAASTVAAVFYRFSEERLGLLWRDWLTHGLVERYLGETRYYRLREQENVQNPDQRIADDVRSFTTQTLSLALILLNTSFTILAFSGVLWSINPALFVAAVAYAALGSLLTVLFGRSLIWLNYDQSDREASLRADLVHVRDSAESVAFSRRESTLLARLQHRVDDVVANSRRIIAVNRNLGFFTTGYNYLIQLIPVVMVAPLFIRGQADFGVISQSSMAFSHVIGAFSLIVTQFQSISSYVVVLARLGALGEAVERLDSRAATRIAIEERSGHLAYEGLTLRSPAGRTLLEGLSLSVPGAARILVSGPNEEARVALFRATAGLWDTGAGRIVRPSGSEIEFLPERPYLPPGTLRAALAEPGRVSPCEEAEIHALLAALGVDQAVERIGGLDVERDWEDVFSLGEQKLLSLVPLVLARPRFALLDRPATTLGTAAVENLLDLLAERSIATVTFAADRGLAERMDAVLDLAADGRWSWHPQRPESATA